MPLPITQREARAETGQFRWHAATIALVIAPLLALLIWILSGVFVFVFPPSDAPKKADVIFVLGPADQRMAYAQQLMDKGYAPTLVISSQRDNYGKFKSKACNDKKPYTVVCFDPEPANTRNEARVLKEMAVKYGWHSANVLTAQFHITRASVIVKRCYSDVHMVAYSEDLPIFSQKAPFKSWAYQYIYQTAAFVKAEFNPEC